MVEQGNEMKARKVRLRISKAHYLFPIIYYQMVKNYWVQIKWQEYKRQAKLLTSQEVLKGILDMLKAEMMHIYTGNLGR